MMVRLANWGQLFRKGGGGGGVGGFLWSKIKVGCCLQVAIGRWPDALFQILLMVLGLYSQFLKFVQAVVGSEQFLMCLEGFSKNDGPLCLSSFESHCSSTTYQGHTS